MQVKKCKGSLLSMKNHVEPQHKTDSYFLHFVDQLFSEDVLHQELFLSTRMSPQMSHLHWKKMLASEIPQVICFTSPH